MDNRRSIDSVKDILQNVIGKIAEKEAEKHNKMERIWENVLNKQELLHTRIDGIKDGVVSVIVDSPAWLYQMKIRKRVILNRLKQELENIKNIYFKIGKI